MIVIFSHWSYNSFMKLNISHIAKLANLPISETDGKKLEGQLIETLDYIEILNGLDTKNIEPTAQVTGLENITRLDEATDSLTQKEALSNTKQQFNGFFQVDAILDND